MIKYTLINLDDANETYTLEATKVEEAQTEALYILGWHVCAEEQEDEES